MTARDSHGGTHRQARLPAAHSRMSRNLLTWPSFYGGANCSIPQARPPKGASPSRALTSRALAKSPTSIRSLDVRSCPARGTCESGDTETRPFVIPAVSHTVAFLRVRTTQSWPRARHPRLVKMTRVWRGRWREQLLSLVLTIQLLILFAMPAARAAGLPSPHIVVRGVLLILAALGLVLARSRGAMAIMILSVALSIAASAWHHERPELVADAGQVLPQLALLWIVSTAVFGRGRATYHRILGAIVMYLAIGMIFVSLDIMLVHLVPDAFTHLSTDPFELRQALIYFSFSTLTTSSFGDILPVHPIARSLANLEAISGQLFPTILLARVVRLQGSKRQESARPGEEDLAPVPATVSRVRRLESPRRSATREGL